MASVSSTQAQEVLTKYQREVKTTDKWGQDTFLKILSAQLQFQDPMEGTDTSQMLSQMAQFTTLEQMQKLNTSFNNMYASFNNMLSSQQVMMASMWIGKEVMAVEPSEKTGEEEGEEAAEPKTVIGKVQGIAFDQNYGVLLVINGKEYSLDQIIAVKETDAEWSAVKPEGSTDQGDGEKSGETDDSQNTTGQAGNTTDGGE